MIELINTPTRVLSTVVIVLGILLSSISHSASISLMPDKKAAAISSQSSHTKAIALYRQAIAALSEGRLSLAQSNFEQSLKHDPQFVHSYLGLAEIANQQKQPLKASELIAKAQHIAPNDPYVLVSIGKLKYEQRQYSETEQAFKQAIQSEPNFFQAHVLLGDLYANVGTDPKKAIAAYEKAIAIDPFHQGAQYALAATQMRSGLLDQALKAYKQLALSDTENPIPLVMIGKILLQKKAYNDALIAYEKALAIDSKMVNAVIGKADTYLALKETDKAKDLYQNALSIYPDSSEAHFKLALQFHFEGKLFEAKKHYKAAILNNENLVVAYNNLATIALEQNRDLIKAQEWAEKAAQLSPSSAPVLDTLGWVYYKNGELDKAIRSLEKSITIDDTNPESNFHLGVLLAEKKLNSRALNVLERALILDPNFKEKGKIEDLIAKIK